MSNDGFFIISAILGLGIPAIVVISSVILFIVKIIERIKEKKLGSEHIGIGNVAARVQMLSPLSSFTVESEKDIGTKVIMKMPLLIVKEEN